MKKVIYLLVFTLSMFILDSSINAWSEYTIGQEVEYNEIKFYVIKDSSTLDDSVTMLKKEPLTVDEVNQYGEGHINRYTNHSQGTAYDSNGYGAVAYYTSPTCTSYQNLSGCTIDYETSEIKYIVDAWANDEILNGLVEARLITYDDLTDNLGYEKSAGGTIKPSSNGNTPSWVYNSNYNYWTMSSYNDSPLHMRGVHTNSYILEVNPVFLSENTVRPVVQLKKRAIEIKEDEQIVPDDNEIVPDDEDSEVNNKIVPEKKNDKKTESSIKVIVENTYMRTSMIIIILGFISAGLGIFAYYKFSNKKK